MRLNKWLIIVLTFSLFLRVYKLNSLELFGDELDVGYQAYSLLKTGKDYMGQTFPTYIHSLSEWRAPLLMYATAPFVAIFGLNEWGVRLAPVFFGVLSIYLLYLLVRKLSKNEKLGLITSFILAITPWHLHYSRAAFEVTLLLSLVLGGTLMFLNKKWLISAILFGLSFYTYNTANIFVLFFGLSLLFIARPKIVGNKKIISAGVVLFIILVPLIISIFSGTGRERFSLISIFNNPKTIAQVVYKRNSGVNPKLERIFYNKGVYWAKEFFSNYLTAFSPQFLFLTGDPNPRHSSPLFGQLYLVFAPLILLGLMAIFKNKNKQLKQVVFSWLLIAPIAGSLTVGGGNQATRLFLMVVPLAILVALGLSQIKIKLINLGIFAVFGFCTLFYFHELTVHYSKESFKYWHYGFEESFSWLAENQDDFDQIIVNNSYEPGLLRYLFWTKANPRDFQKQFTGDQIKENILANFNGFSVNNFYFGSIAQEDKLGWLQENLNKDTIYMAVQLDEAPGDWDWGQDSPEGLVILKTVYNPLGSPLFYWLTKK